MTHVGDYVADMVALEQQVSTLLSDRADDIADPRVEPALRRFQQLVEEHLDALGERLAELDNVEVGEPVWVAHLPSYDRTIEAGPDPVIHALHAWYSAFNHMALGYAILHAVAHRWYDSEGDGNTADLAERHLRRYAAAAQEINQLIADVVVSHLDSAGQECRCRCPSCTLGICVCAPHGTITINKAWRETSPAPAAPGIEVRRPRRGSPAAEAGLTEGDRVTAADGQQIATDLDVPTLQAAVRGRAAGQAVVLDVLARSGETQRVDVARPS